ncbi:MAG TPA: hypothetical protein VJM31_06405 [Vicinamibacterales bacterium]|nr:hypothetical protein [Vicinamibacterales bacterium]
MTIRHPPPAVEGIASDSADIGTIHDVSPQLAILMIAAGWMRNDTRSLMRRQQDSSPITNRRQMTDRRSDTGE